MMWATILLFGGCTEQTVAVYNTPPAAQITSPENGDAVELGDLVELAGKVIDNQGVDDLLVVWDSDIDGELGLSDADSSGLVYLAVAALSPGTHVITLTVEDPDFLTGSDAISLRVGGSADDVDGDGYPSSVDCDDNDAEINPDATEVAWDDIDQDCDGVDLHDYVSIHAGGYFTCAVSTVGELVCWGSDYFGQVTDAPSVLPDQIDGGNNHACAHFPGDTAACWGVDDSSDADYGQVTQTPAVSFAAVSAGGAHSCGLTPSGAVRCWGWDESGQVSGIPEGLVFQSLSAGAFHTCGVLTSKAIRCWGAQDGGPYDAGQSQAPSTVNFDSVGAGYLHSCARTVTGGIQCWGDDDDGQVSDTPNDDEYSALSVGPDHNCALTKIDGRVVCWGENAEGQTVEPDEDGFTAVAAGGEHSCALDAVGRAVCWGDDTSGQSTPP